MDKIGIIAEPDISHGNKLHRIIDGINQTANAGGDFYKLQVYNCDKLGMDWMWKYDYYKSRELDNDTIIYSLKNCNVQGITLLCTVFDMDQAKRLWNLGVKNIKIPSGMVNDNMLDSIMPYDWDRIFISTGMSGDGALSKIYFDYEDLVKKKEVILMHCVSLYPTMETEVNMRRMESIDAKFIPVDSNHSVGYSDHTVGMLACELAMDMGASYIEKHVHQKGEHSPVDSVACEWWEFKNLCRRRDVVSRMMGDGSLTMQERENQTLAYYEGRWDG